MAFGSPSCIEEARVSSSIADRESRGEEGRTKRAVTPHIAALVSAVWSRSGSGMDVFVLVGQSNWSRLREQISNPPVPAAKFFFALRAVGGVRLRGGRLSIKKGAPSAVRAQIGRR